MQSETIHCADARIIERPKTRWQKFVAHWDRGFALLKWCLFAGMGAAGLVLLRQYVHWGWSAAAGVCLAAFLLRQWSRYGFLALYRPQAGNTAIVWVKRIALLGLAALGSLGAYMGAAELAMQFLICFGSWMFFKAC